MSTTRSPLYERDLALPVKDYLRAEGWELYEEVPYLGKIPDIVCSWESPGGGEHLLAVVELKTSQGFPIIAQGVHWLEHAHESWIAVPAGKPCLERTLALELCQSRGVGVLEVRPLSKLEEERIARGIELTEPRVLQIHEATRRRIYDDGAGLRAALAPEHRSGVYAGAGTKTGKRWNATEKRNEAVRTYLEQCEDRSARLDQVARHLFRDERGLRFNVERGEVARVRLNGTGPTVMLELVEAGDEAPIYSARSLRTRKRA